jgi:ceramide glucosyltransferase
MDALALTALIFAAAALLIHLLTVGIAIARTRKLSPAPTRAMWRADPVTILRPVCGLDPFEDVTLRTTFLLDHPNYEIIFCCAREHDPVVPLVRALMAEYPEIRSRLLFGDDRSTPNPKLNNLIKGWEAATTPWVIMADSNVLMPPSYVGEMFAAFRPGTGLVCSPPVGSHPRGAWAELECAFLNTYQARWQLSADAIGLGFAQGKSMLWRKYDLDKAGGIGALALEIAEDAAATKIVRQRGLRVSLVDRPYAQPLGYKTAAQVWHRQVRWARLRRSTFIPYYMLEILTGSLTPALAAAYTSANLEINPVATVAALWTVWYGAEAVLAKSAKWHMTAASPIAWLARDLALPVLWIQGFMGNRFTWRGNEMTVASAANRS